ncbi:MAG TPA: AIR synthase-related protein, partial [Candidatus Polarisedimenticolaceae bacterium]|nr:AIR synthase-related protein [Candidatus Polarisedimenticolaceae bacterium]
RAAMAAELGLELDLASCPDLVDLDPHTALFSESLGRFLITCAEPDAAALERCFEGQACRRVGRVTAEPRLRVRAGGRIWLDASVASLKAAFQEALGDE